MDLWLGLETLCGDAAAVAGILSTHGAAAGGAGSTRFDRYVRGLQRVAQRGGGYRRLLDALQEELGAAAAPPAEEGTPTQAARIER